MTDEVPLPGAPAPEPASTPPAPSEPSPVWPAEPAITPVWSDPDGPPAPAPVASETPVVPPAQPFGITPEFGTQPPHGAPGFGAPQGFGAPAEPTPAAALPGATLPGFTTPPDGPTSTGFAMGPGTVFAPGYGPSPYGAPPPYLPPAPPKSRKGLVIGLVAGAVVLVLACCGGAIALTVNSKPKSSGTAAGAGISTPSSSPSPTATPISATDYAAKLVAIDQQLSTSSTALAGARNLSEVENAARSLGGDLDTAGRDLNDIAPPAAVSSINFTLSSALMYLANEVGNLAVTTTETHSACAGSSAIAQMSTSSYSDEIRTAAKNLAAASADYVFGKFLPPPTRGTSRRLSNGQQIKKASGGAGQLTAENQGDKDAVLTLATEGASAAAAVFYVQAGQKATIKGIKDGSYRVYIATGIDWDANLRVFTVSCQTTENTDAMAFTTTHSTYSVWTLTFGLSSGGTDPLNPVDPSQIPA